MQLFEYQVVPAPRRGDKVKGVKTTEARFALSLTAVMNQMARDGWEYLRADTLPVEERVGLTGKATTFHHLLVFRRPVSRAGAIPGQEVVPSVVAASLTAAPEPLRAPSRPLFGGASRSEGAEVNPAPALGPADVADRPAKGQAAE